jgi:hypothetical protein
MELTSDSLGGLPFELFFEISTDGYCIAYVDVIEADSAATRGPLSELRPIIWL